MSQMQSLLIELGTEELPVKALPGLAQALFDGTLEALNKRGIAVERGDAKPLYTPRRLAVLLPGVAAEQPEQRSEVLGPYLNIALGADGQPTKALEGFAAKAGVTWTQLEKTSDAKGERFVHRAVKPGAKTIDLLPEILREAMAAMPIPKPMRWGERDVGFARPVHWLVMLFGDAVVDGEVFGIKADRMSRGHRMMHEKPVWIGTPDVYVDALRAAKVLADPDERRARVVAEVESAALRAGGSPRITEDNLEQVQCLVEWPKAVLCAFEREFLAVPQEALIATMEANQKFFPVLDADGKLTEHFVGIANIESKDESEVRKGYERVIRPRFADAKFFFDEDLKQGLVSMNEGLKTVTYLKISNDSSMSWHEKVQHDAEMAVFFAKEFNVDQEKARQAALISKADLQSRMVNEFPELQGIAGRYYALAEGIDPEIAVAIDEAYKPRFAGDAIPSTPLGQTLACAHRLHNLVFGFMAGLKPSGNKDAFGMRRNALGLARIIIEGGLEDKNGAGGGEVYEFVVERLRGYYAERGYTPQQFESVNALKPDSLHDFDRRLKAIGAFAKLPEAEALAAANKRIRNIVRKADVAIPDAPNPALYDSDAERDLHAAIEQAIADTDPLLASRDYVAVLGRLARLRPEVDDFFLKVLVNADDPAVRANRLALLQRLADRLGSVAAIEHLSV